MRTQTITWYKPSEKLPNKPCSVLIKTYLRENFEYYSVVSFHPIAKIEYGLLEKHGRKLHPLFYEYDSEWGDCEIPIERIIEWAEVEE